MALKPIRVREVMTRDVFAVAPDTSLETAARLFATRQVSGAPVVESSGRPVGVVTQSDLVDPDRERSEKQGRAVYYRLGGGAREVQLDDNALPDGVVSDVMSPFVLSVPPDMLVFDAARLMLTDGVHRLLVVENDRVVGILSSTDVLRAVVKPRAWRAA
jgi:CBS domain-containing protein